MIVESNCEYLCALCSGFGRQDFPGRMSSPQPSKCTGELWKADHFRAKFAGFLRGAALLRAISQSLCSHGQSTVGLPAFDQPKM